MAKKSKLSVAPSAGRDRVRRWEGTREGPSLGLAPPASLDGVTMEMATINADLAAKWLETSIGNRPISQPHVTAMSRDILAGEWRVTGDTIKFDPGGRLIDGHHRLWAVMMAGGPSIETWVAKNVLPTVQIDVGRVRTFGDVLKMRGTVDKASATIVAAACSWFMRYELTTIKSSTRFSQAELTHCLSQHPFLPDVAKRLGRPPYKLLSAGAIAFVGTHGMEVAPEAADAFLSILLYGAVEGQPVHVKSPPYVLRERLLLEGSKRTRMESVHVLEIAIRAWNAHIRGEEISRLLTVDGEFPRFIR
jgi:hypothetical protein